MKTIERYITANNPLEDEMDLFRAILDVCIDLKKSIIGPTEATIRVLEIKNYFHEKKAAATKTLKPTFLIKGDISPSDLIKQVEKMCKTNQPKEHVQLEKKELQEIFEGNEDAVKTMEQVFKEHESIETVVVDPNSWVGKELLSQTKRLIDLQRDVHSLSTLIKKYSTRTLKGEMPNESSTNAL
ncbi:hypothetical protein M5W76_18015 [Paenibacillus larvae]|uniref:Uncharacterized protein n=6 Tax=root TaxID=1 RepID=A0A2I7SCW9_9CAUD|nr:hypothetical protein [Paenibacillus larvae]YP_009836308.1 hypothetical protein HWB43_gp51 [Paenibacillus phage BN12]YP_009836457.1 hypothetical protein HWB45_gp48 [Paenibacillus phage Pagassa]YP_009838742.1 hypothetical protein HWB71_gp42 [Paenibacillus phage Kawika]YP_009838879.1 hypothetical protein HWB73_gp43 [Paenibacillus phage Eltigre]AXF39603.1 hypothetical protein HONEYBEAR_44 [Paenibacillus phage Honeybear]AXF40547.1 hypothetical protein TOOTHLESS_42 [Paenibacillus phage Toothless